MLIDQSFIEKQVSKSNWHDVLSPPFKRILLDSLYLIIISVANDNLDFALAFAVVHEIPDQHKLMSQVYDALAEGGRLLISEPKGNISAESFAKTEEIAKAAGFKVVQRPEINRNISILAEKVSKS